MVWGVGDCGVASGVFCVLFLLDLSRVGRFVCVGVVAVSRFVVSFAVRGLICWAGYTA